MSSAAPSQAGPRAGPDPSEDAGRSRRAGVVVAALVVAVTLALGGVLVSAQLPGEGLPANPVGVAAPDFRLATLDGAELALADLDGEPVLLSFWASWCTTCKADMPVLSRLARSWQPRGVTVVGVVIEDTLPAAVEVALEHGLPYRSVFDEHDEVARAYSVTGTPETYLIADGTVVAKWIGPVPEHDVEFQLAQATR
jgi:cytochrome c biogenesis protein CcmG, thiol:disulfide interchange protein DsbE